MCGQEKKNTYISKINYSQCVRDMGAYRICVCMDMKQKSYNMWHFSRGPKILSKHNIKIKIEKFNSVQVKIR